MLGQSFVRWLSLPNAFKTVLWREVQNGNEQVGSIIKSGKCWNTSLTMTAQPPTKPLSADFAATLRNLSSSSDENSHSITSENHNSNSSFFNSEDFQKFLHEHKDNKESLDQIFKTSEFFKSQESLFKSRDSLPDLFKSQQSFTQMFQSKDSFAELFQSLDNDQKQAFFEEAQLVPPCVPAMESPSRSSTRSSFIQPSMDWKNLGNHVDVNYSPKLFRDTSSSTGSDTHDPLSIQQPTSVDSSKTNWGDLLFSQLQPAASVAPVAAVAPSTVASVAPVPSPVAPLPSTTKTKGKAAPRKSGKRYIANPTDTDILMGRGGKSNHHPGNKRYREEIQNFKKTYSELTNKEEKTDLSRHVVDFVHKYKGRFLALDKTHDPPRWYEITDAVARRKVSQALREDVDPVKRQEKRARFLERKRQKEQEE